MGSNPTNWTMLYFKNFGSIPDAVREINRNPQLTLLQIVDVDTGYYAVCSSSPLHEPPVGWRA